MTTATRPPDSEDVACPWSGCEYTSETRGGVKRHHAKAHGESLGEGVRNEQKLDK